MSDSKRYYVIEWYKKNKYGNNVTRHTNVSLPRFTGDTAVDSKMALQIFIKNNGNLNKIEVVKIKEFNEHGQIGEDITPSNNAIIPVGR